MPRLFQHPKNLGEQLHALTEPQQGMVVIDVAKCAVGQQFFFAGGHMETRDRFPWCATPDHEFHDRHTQVDRNYQPLRGTFPSRMSASYWARGAWERDTMDMALCSF